MPEEILIIIVMSLFFGTTITIVKAVLGYRERTRFGLESNREERSERRLSRRAGKQPQGQSLTTSELEEMMKRAVTDATRPLRGQLDGIEGRLDALEAAKPAPALDAHLDDEILDPRPSKTIGTRVR